MRTWLTSTVCALSALAAACGSEPGLMPFACEALGASPGNTAPPSVDDPLEVIVHIDSITGPGELLVRVDGLDETGAVRFETTPPPEAAAVSLASTTSGAFQGCFSEAPRGFALRTPSAPRDKIWLRVSSERVVDVRVETGPTGDGATRVTEVSSVQPGTSARTPWAGGD